MTFHFICQKQLGRALPRRGMRALTMLFDQQIGAHPQFPLVDHRPRLDGAIRINNGAAEPFSQGVPGRGRGVCLHPLKTRFSPRLACELNGALLTQASILTQLAGNRARKRAIVRSILSQIDAAGAVFARVDAMGGNRRIWAVDRAALVTLLAGIAAALCHPRNVPPSWAQCALPRSASRTRRVVHCPAHGDTVPDLGGRIKAAVPRDAQRFLPPEGDRESYGAEQAHEKQKWQKTAIRRFALQPRISSSGGHGETLTPITMADF